MTDRDDIDRRNAAAMRSAEAAWLEPPDDGEDDRLTDDTALEQARDELQRTPAEFTAWLCAMCEGASEPADLSDKVIQIDGAVLHPQEIETPSLAWLMVNAPRFAQQCMVVLRERFEIDTFAFARARARELLDEQDRADDRMREDAEAARCDAIDREREDRRYHGPDGNVNFG